MRVTPLLKITEAQYKRLLERMVLREEGKAPLIAGEALQRPGFTTQGPLSRGAIPVGGPPPLAGPGAPSPFMRANEQGMPQFTPMGTGMRIPTQVSQLEPSPIDDVMASAPPRELIMARLQRQKEGVPFSEPAMETKDYPYFEARRKYVTNPWSEENPGGYKPVGVPGSSVKRLRTVPEGVTSGKNQDMGGGLNYSLTKFKSVETPFERKARKIAEEPVIREKGVPTPSLPEILSTATLLERMWQLMGGKRTETGKIWNKLREQSPGRNKVVDTKDYFIRCGLRWREDPEKFARQWPREARLFAGMWDELSPKAQAGEKRVEKYTKMNAGEGRGVE